MKIWPLRFRETSDSKMLFVDETGSWFKSNDDFLERYATNALSDEDLGLLRVRGHAFDKQNDLSYNSFAYRWSRRLSETRPLSYVILVPTLRCNLSCTYCQVSRAAETAAGYDWDEDTLNDVLAFLGRIEGNSIKIEFQGGEPLLRVDLLERVRDFCRAQFQQSEFVVCTNLQSLGEREWAFLASDDTHVSTSIDGTAEEHNRQRTQNPVKLAEFLSNLDRARQLLGKNRLSALPTIDIDRLPNPNELIDNFLSYGLNSIYLRPINHQGFARRLGQRPDEIERWSAFHCNFIELLIERNSQSETIVSEYYFTQCLKRVLFPRINNHVDIRNPNLFASDYVVVNYDGKLYPTDESRMLSRIGQIDLSVGDVRAGLDTQKVAALNTSACNNFDPDCVHCPYQPFCGTDLIDDISRYGRVDVPRLDTWFCKRHMSLFDKVFELIYRDDRKTRRSLAAWLDIPEWNDAMRVEHP